MRHDKKSSKFFFAEKGIPAGTGPPLAQVHFFEIIPPNGRVKTGLMPGIPCQPVDMERTPFKCLIPT